VTVGFIDVHRDVYEVESICAVLPIAPSTYFRHKARSGRIRPGARRGRSAMTNCARSFAASGTEHFQVYGPRKVW
jgi:hypothetical protein